MRWHRLNPAHRDRWVISRHATPGRGRFLYWHPTDVYGWTNNRNRAARFPTYTEAVRAAESIHYRDRLEVGRI